MDYIAFNAKGYYAGWDKKAVMQVMKVREIDVFEMPDGPGRSDTIKEVMGTWLRHHNLTCYSIPKKIAYGMFVEWEKHITIKNTSKLYPTQGPHCEAGDRYHVFSFDSAGWVQVTTYVGRIKQSEIVWQEISWHYPDSYDVLEKSTGDEKNNLEILLEDFGFVVLFCFPMNRYIKLFEDGHIEYAAGQERTSVPVTITTEPVESDKQTIRMKIAAAAGAEYENAVSLLVSAKSRDSKSFAVVISVDNGQKVYHDRDTRLFGPLLPEVEPKAKPKKVHYNLEEQAENVGTHNTTGFTLTPYSREECDSIPVILDKKSKEKPPMLE